MRETNHSVPATMSMHILGVLGPSSHCLMHDTQRAVAGAGKMRTGEKARDHSSPCKPIL